MNGGQWERLGKEVSEGVETVMLERFCLLYIQSICLCHSYISSHYPHPSPRTIGSVLFILSEFSGLLEQKELSVLFLQSAILHKFATSRASHARGAQEKILWFLPPHPTLPCAIV